MIRHNREIEDEEDEQLVVTGWTMVGLTLWRHPKFGSFNFTKSLALDADLSDYHPINMEHYKLLNLVKWLASDGEGKTITYSVKECIDRAKVLLSEMKYI